MARMGYKTALFHSGRFSFWDKLDFYRDRGFDLMQDAKTLPGARKSKKLPWGIDEFITVRAVNNFIKKHKNDSFFIQYINVFPHAPYKYLEGDYAIFPEKANIDKYHNCLRYADAAIKGVVDNLKKLKLLDDTLLIFVGDHGEAFYEHPGNRVHSIYIYEENVHVAMAMVNPILFPKSRRTSQVTSHIDILPTVADLIGAERNSIWQGKSLLEDHPSGPVYFFANWGRKFVGVRDGDFKVIWDKKVNDLQVYDLKKDPFERKNIVSTYEDRVGRYRDVLRDWWTYQTIFIKTFGKSKEEERRLEKKRQEEARRKALRRERRKKKREAEKRKRKETQKQKTEINKEGSAP